MPLTIDYYGGIASPWTYLGHDRICDLATKYQAELVFKPIDFGTVFSATGGLPLPKRSPQRQKYRMQELKRWRDELNIPLISQPKFFPVAHTEAALMVMAAKKNGQDDLKLAGEFLKALWAKDMDISSTEKLVELSQKAGFDGETLIAEATAPDLQASYEANTKDAIENGVFGAPTYVIGDDVFWGQDRLHFVEKRLKESN